MRTIAKDKNIETATLHAAGEVSADALQKVLQEAAEGIEFYQALNLICHAVLITMELSEQK